MDIPQLIRTARRHAGLSQRDLAQRLGIAPSTVAAWEAGSRRPTLRALERVGEAVGLELTLVAHSPVTAPELTAHLRLPLTARLRLALGEAASPYRPATGAAWQTLLTLARVGTVVVEPPVALGVWVPQPPRATVDVTVHGPRRQVPPVELARVRIKGSPAPASLVPITLAGPVRVWVLPPAELLAAEAAALRDASLLLDAHAAVDDGGRRRPAHRDPNEWREGSRLLVTKAGGRLELPRGEFSRGWRLRAPASLAQLLREQGR